MKAIPSPSQPLGRFALPGLITLPVLLGLLVPPTLAQTPSLQSEDAKGWWQRCQQEWNAGQYAVAEQSCQKALLLYRDRGDRQAEATVLSGLGVIHSSLHHDDKAVEYQIQGLEVAKISHNEQLVVKAWLNLGQAYAPQSNFAREITAYEEGLHLARKIRFLPGELAALNFLAHAHSRQHNLSQVIFYQEQSLPLARQLKDARSEVRSRINLGNAYIEVGKVNEAIAVLEPGVAIAQEQHWQTELAWIDQNLGGAYRIRGDYAKAIDLHQRSLLVARTVKDRELETVALHEIGRVYESKGDYAKSIEFYQQGYQLAKTLNHPKHQIRALNGLGLAYYNLGDFDRAIALQEQQLTLAQQTQDLQGQSWALSLLGLTYSAKRDFQKGVDSLQAAARLMQQGGDLWGKAAVLANLGGAYRNQGNDAKAIDAYEQSLAIVRSLNSPAQEGRILVAMGSVYRNLKQFDKAVALYQKGLILTRQVGDETATSYALTNLGLMLYWQGDLPQAESFLRQAIAGREALRTRLGEKDALKVALADMEITNTAYLNLQRTLIAQNKFEAALEVAEQGRARAFAELIAKRLSGSNIAPLPLPTLAHIRQVAKQQNATLVEYSILDNSLNVEERGEHGDAQIAIWVVQPSGQISFRQVSLSSLVESQKSLTQLVANGRGTLRIRSLGMAHTQKQTQGLSKYPMQALYQLLVQPIADLLPADPEAKVIFIPQGSLFLVPFAALQTLDGQYLIQRHTLVIAPSIQVLNLTRQAKDQWQKANANSASNLSPALVIGNPTMPKIPRGDGELPQQLEPLPGAEIEAQAIAHLIKTQAITGDAATKAFVTQQMQQARIVHLATHGLLEDFQQSGIPGAIALAPTANDNGILTAAELLTLNLQADLIVLSACDTGRGKITGDGVVGLSRSLIAAGTPSVVVSLWSVPDAPTAALMTEFYRHLLNHSDKAHALRQAMLTTMHKYPSPIDWAAFILIGES
ncbi:CHAT domain-containing protein (plasmid) [Kovacikia minuta CCNUW1]|uniref:CHAT domain-containing protein n=1 Tax=Kovacikia minuta TaxID=2931930 RepID=UPI001CC98CFD|nr:CHAT domain-containing protein [Kovacikia minuta]UBF30272.1 CHAT domain-containing protein [Kovacikia minuta CCNUW1]